METPKPLFRSRTVLLGLLTTIAGIVGASNDTAAAFIRDHVEIILGVLGIVSIILRRITHGKVVLIPDIGDDMGYRNLSVMTTAAAGILCAFTGFACSASGGGPSISLDLANGICATSGHYRVCYNPLTKGFSVRSTLPANQWVRDLTYDSASKQWRGTLPDGSTAVYANGQFHIEPALPQPAEPVEAAK